jgi:hypothetical protein
MTDIAGEIQIHKHTRTHTQIYFTEIHEANTKISIQKRAQLTLGIQLQFISVLGMVAQVALVLLERVRHKRFAVALGALARRRGCRCRRL